MFRTCIQADTASCMETSRFDVDEAIPLTCIIIIIIIIQFYIAHSPNCPNALYIYIYIYIKKTIIYN